MFLAESTYNIWKKKKTLIFFSLPFSSRRASHLLDPIFHRRIVNAGRFRIKTISILLRKRKKIYQAALRRRKLTMLVAIQAFPDSYFSLTILFAVSVARSIHQLAVFKGAGPMWAHLLHGAAFSIAPQLPRLLSNKDLESKWPGILQ